MKLMMDEMLMRLGRWLRAAGYDTAIASPGANDRDILADAVREGRLLVTCDRKLCEFRDADRHVLLLRGQTLDAQAREIAARLGIDWLHRPFSRCLLCNGLLRPGGPEALARVPPASRQAGVDAWRCDACGRIYWSGSHVRRMRRRLEAWQRLARDGGSGL
ncbi:MAG: DUF5615 family PIN-like protein [Mariprofundaceae bacterium]